MSQIKHIHLYRNGEVLNNRAEAVSKLNSFVTGSTYSDNLDGVAILARYYTDSSKAKVETLVGVAYGSGNTPSSITIFDKEGTNISINSINEQLKALSGTTASTSGDTSVYGAKKYTEGKIAELNVIDNPQDNKFVTSVSETDGKITVNRGAVSSSASTVSVTKATDGGVNLDVNIDGNTIVKDNDGKLSVASAALTQYVGTSAITISSADASNNKTVSLKIKSGDKVLSQTSDGLSATLSISYDSASRELRLKGINNEVISKFDATEFVKDGMLNDTAVFTASGATQEVTFKGGKHTYSGLTDGNHYLAFEFITSSGSSTSSYNYEVLDATSIIDVYIAGDGLALNSHTFSVKKDNDSEGFLSVGKNGVKISGVQDAINNAKTEVKIASGESHVTLSSASTDTHTVYTISSNDVASATALTAETSNRESGDKKIWASVGLSEDGSHKKTNGNYTSSANTVVEEIAALDTQVKRNTNNIASNKPIGGDGITVTSGASGSTISIKLADNDSGLSTTTNGLAIDFSALDLDCGTYN